ncbi:hypothetical protein LP414_26675 [Polaromonas sp. P1(28)-13]|nr:hypothetical protein LP414_26675 [Polaromonas sp. P1(28)-13]
MAAYIDGAQEGDLLGHGRSSRVDGKCRMDWHYVRPAAFAAAFDGDFGLKPTVDMRKQLLKK